MVRGEPGLHLQHPPFHPHPRSLVSFVITSWLLRCAEQLAELRRGWKVRPLKGNYFIDTIRDDSLFDVSHPAPAPHPNCSPGSTEFICVPACVCVCWWGASLCFLLRVSSNWCVNLCPIYLFLWTAKFHCGLVLITFFLKFDPRNKQREEEDTIEAILIL